MYMYSTTYKKYIIIAWFISAYSSYSCTIFSYVHALKILFCTYCNYIISLATMIIAFGSIAFVLINYCSLLHFADYCSLQNYFYFYFLCISYLCAQIN